jgi:ATP/maltotriose-dependent transcriptional regulator MalT
VPADRAVCEKCSADASIRSARRRQTIRTKAETERGVKALESVGDTYSMDGDHRAAMKNYERAFTLSAEDLPARTRLAAKVGRAAFLYGVAAKTDDWFNTSFEAGAPGSPSIADLYTQQARVLWSSSRTAEIVALSERVLAFATASNNVELMCLSRLWLASVSHHLSRYGDAKRYLAAVDVAQLPADPKILCMYDRVSGYVSTSTGDAESAFASFEKALHHAESDRDYYAVTTILIADALCATLIGRIDLAAAWFLRALRVSRENNHLWNVAYVSLEYARVLSRQGNRHQAHAYVNAAATYANPPPFLVEALAEIGIPIALECHDDHLLERCANEEALAFAFRSGEPPRIGPVAASFARYYRKTGRSERAQEVIERALGFVTNADQSYDLPMAAAEFGDARSLVPAREVLRTRASLPNARLAIAHLHAFDALVFGREGNREACAREAKAASRSFHELGWVSHASFATALLPSPARTFEAFGLSSREEAVAKLAIAERSNREIAEELAITVRTVEAHMTSILRRLGLRSRHQLLETIKR